MERYGRANRGRRGGVPLKSRRILVVLPNAPLPFGNAGARWYFVLCRELVRRGHRVTAFAVCADEEEISATKEMFPPPAYDMRCYLRPYWQGVSAKWESFWRPHSYLFSSELKDDIRRQMLGGFDILHLEQVWAGWAAPGNQASTLLNVHYLFELDMASYTPWSLRERVVGIRSQRATRQLLRRSPHICTLTSRLTNAVRTISPRSDVNTIPLGIDADLYPFIVPELRSRLNPVIGLVGSFDWQPTYSAGRRLLDDLWPRIREKVPAARLLIAGRAAARAFAADQGTPGLTIYSDVPDIIPYFREIDVLVYAPNHGSGMKVKILEAFALGVPVVTNEDGIEGLPAKDGMHAGICNDDTGLVERAVAALLNPEYWRQQSIAARELVETHCNPASVVNSLESVYSQILKRA